jgi:lyso-ornithine lipid O-acyltransferase
VIVGLRIVKEGDHQIMVSNHISWLDIIVLGRFLPAHFVAKSEILIWPVIGYLAKQAGTIFIRRGDKQQVKATAEEMLWLLKQNSTIIAFPEGTTDQGDEVLSLESIKIQQLQC